MAVQGQAPQWEVVDALAYAWRELRHMPVSISDPLAECWVDALEAVRIAYVRLDSNAPADSIEAARRGVAQALGALRLVVKLEQAHELLDNVSAGFCDAGIDLSDWSVVGPTPRNSV